MVHRAAHGSRQGKAYPITLGTGRRTERYHFGGQRVDMLPGSKSMKELNGPPELVGALRVDYRRENAAHEAIIVRGVFFISGAPLKMPSTGRTVRPRARSSSDIDVLWWDHG